MSNSSIYISNRSANQRTVTELSDTNQRYSPELSHDPVFAPIGVEGHISLGDRVNYAEGSCALSGLDIHSDSRPDIVPPGQMRSWFRYTVPGCPTGPAYCLDFFLHPPQGDFTSISVDDAMSGFSSQVRCAVSWILANGYGADTVIREWNSALGIPANALTTDDAEYVTQVAIWETQGSLPTDYRWVPCSNGFPGWNGTAASAQKISYITTATKELVRRATSYAMTHNCISTKAAASSKQQAASSKQQAASSKQQAASSKRIDSGIYRNCALYVVDNVIDVKCITTQVQNSDHLSWLQAVGKPERVNKGRLFGPFIINNSSASMTPGVEPVFRIVSGGHAASFADKDGSFIRPAFGRPFYVWVSNTKIAKLEVCVQISHDSLTDAQVMFFGTSPTTQNIGIRTCRSTVSASEQSCVDITIADPDNSFVPQKPTPIEFDIRRSKRVNELFPTGWQYEWMARAFDEELKQEEYKLHARLKQFSPYLVNHQYCASSRGQCNPVSVCRMRYCQPLSQCFPMPRSL